MTGLAEQLNLAERGLLPGRNVTSNHNTEDFRNCPVLVMSCKYVRCGEVDGQFHADCNCYIVVQLFIRNGLFYFFRRYAVGSGCNCINRRYIQPERFVCACRVQTLYFNLQAGLNLHTVSALLLCKFSSLKNQILRRADKTVALWIEIFRCFLEVFTCVLRGCCSSGFLLNRCILGQLRHAGQVYGVLRYQIAAIL